MLTGLIAGAIIGFHYGFDTAFETTPSVKSYQNLKIITHIGDSAFFAYKNGGYKSAKLAMLDYISAWEEMHGKEGPIVGNTCYFSDRGNSSQALEKATLILWKGYCLVHTRFTIAQMESMRKKDPGAQIVVHPECTQEVVNLADAVGSTSYIVNYVGNAAPGSRIIIGTEINLVKRLAAEHTDKTVIPLYDSFCPNMYKISPEKLLETLEHPEKNLVTVPEDVQARP